MGPNEEWKSAEAMNYLLNNITISARTRSIDSRRRRRQALLVDFNTFEIRNEGKLFLFPTLPTRQRQRKVLLKSHQILNTQVLVFIIHVSTCTASGHGQLCDDALVDPKEIYFIYIAGNKVLNKFYQLQSAPVLYQPKLGHLLRV